MRVVSSDFFFFFFFFFFEPPLENSELALKIEVSEIEFGLFVPSRQPPAMRRQVGGKERREEGWGHREGLRRQQLKSLLFLLAGAQKPIISSGQRGGSPLGALRYHDQDKPQPLGA